MLTKDLIKQLQSLVDFHPAGTEEHEIMIDYFEVEPSEKLGIFKYIGYSRNISIDITGDGAYLTLSGVAE